MLSNDTPDQSRLGHDPTSPRDHLIQRLSCTTITFGCSISEKLAAMSAAGFQATELFPRDTYADPRGPDYTRGLLGQYGLTVSAYQALRDYEGVPESDRAHVVTLAENMMQQMAWLGCDLLVVAASSRVDSSRDRDVVAADLRRLADLADRYSVRIAYENTSSAKWFGDYRDTWDLVQRVERANFGLLLDCYHIFIQGQPLTGLSEIDPERIFLVEISDAPKANLSYYELMRYHRLFPGEGTAPLAEFVARLEALGYSGTYAVEVMSTHYSREPPTEVAKRAMETTAALFSGLD
jgi:4-hydroxyphenylpyruvate dioxygenase